ncbi:MAG: hypothetical protein J5736_04815, partial [Bacilli bacterium]|nr:hypothetical protein [Bacilli bacterium]
MEILTLLSGFALSIGLVVGAELSSRNPSHIEATSHSANYSPYQYAGDYYNSLPSSFTQGMNGSLRSALTTLIKPKEVGVYSS